MIVDTCIHLLVFNVTGGIRDGIGPSNQTCHVQYIHRVETDTGYGQMEVLHTRVWEEMMSFSSATICQQGSVAQASTLR